MSTWYERELKKYSIDFNSQIVAWIIISLSFSIWFYFTAWEYRWEHIEIIPLIPWVKALLSALTYITIWSLLYKSQLLYRPLYFIFVTIFNDRKTYKQIKHIIWIILWLLMYFFILPVVVTVLNLLISIIYNIILFIFYISPPIVISCIVILGFIYFKK